MKVIEQTLTTPLTKNAKLVSYILDNSDEIEPNRRRPAVILCPGGGYVMTSDREAEPQAIQMLAAGFQAFVLRYNVAPARFPVALLELAEAVKTVRANAEAWHVDPDKIIVGGMSAGGHVAASLATMWNCDLVKSYHYQAAEIKPNGLLLGYSVLTSGPLAHRGSFDALLGDKKDDPIALAEVSLEKRVTADTPKTFLWHTAADDTVPVENTLLFASALAAHKVPFEVHIFPNGGHGLSLGTAETAINGNGYGIEPDITPWVSLFITWAKHNI